MCGEHPHELLVLQTSSDELLLGDLAVLVLVHLLEHVPGLTIRVLAQHPIHVTNNTEVSWSHSCQNIFLHYLSISPESMDPSLLRS